MSAKIKHAIITKYTRGMTKHDLSSTIKDIYSIKAEKFFVYSGTLPFFRPQVNKYKFFYDDDVIQCYITGNNSQSYSGY